MFQFPELSAVKIAGDELNTGIFVFEPNQSTFRDMLATYTQAPSYYMGEQGFLNWFFLNRTTQVISARYNTVVRLKVQEILIMNLFVGRITQYGRC